MNSDYIELRARSAFSFLEGATTPEDLAARAAELGYSAMALGDRDGLTARRAFTWPPSPRASGKSSALN